jgi:hypothetical protein
LFRLSGLFGERHEGVRADPCRRGVLATVPLITSSNVVLNFLVVALLIALGPGWNLLGGMAASIRSVTPLSSAPAPMSPPSCRRIRCQRLVWLSSSALPRVPWSGL